jgi:hypothetical protein
MRRKVQVSESFKLLYNCLHVMSDGNSARSAPVQSDIENQAGTKTNCLPAPMQCSAEMTTTDAGLCVHPAYPHPSVQHDACMNAGGMGPTSDVDPTLDADPTLDVGLTPDSDPIPSSPIINVNPAPPHPTRAPTAHVPARSDSAIGESEDNCEHATFVIYQIFAGPVHYWCARRLRFDQFNFSIYIYKLPLTLLHTALTIEDCDIESAAKSGES